MKQYLDALNNIAALGTVKSSGRENMPNVIGTPGYVIDMPNVGEDYPLLTTKRMYWKGIIHELIWFLHGNTNIKYLVSNNVNIWNKDAYRWYLKWYEESGHKVSKKLETLEEFIDAVKQGDDNVYFWKTELDDKTYYSYYASIMGKDTYYKLGDLGKVYGHQWRNQNGVDQIADLIDSLQNRPYSRYHILDAWNKVDFKEMALPPCHLLYQFVVDPTARNTKVLNCLLYQRSCDMVLGVPFNLASVAALTIILAAHTDMIPGDVKWIGGDTHIYLPHLDAVNEQIQREPRILPKLVYRKKDNGSINDITIDDFDLVGYAPHLKLENETELFVGLKNEKTNKEKKTS